jgi:CRP-like cAMP-binding protein
MRRDAVLFDQGERIERLYFPEAGIVSLVVVLQDGHLIEAGMIGADGVAGTSTALNGTKALNRAIVQTGGPAFFIEAGKIKSALLSSASMREAIYRHDQIVLAQAQQSAACNAIHQIEERLCRWLLRAADLLQSRDLFLTQEFLGQMLGVRRTSVTLVAHRLQALNLIKYRRGHIQLLDLDGLTEAACECYEAIKTQREMVLAAAN